ncbi:MAG: hypothetical protein NTV34_05565, partial [Proteobacteria bacterium]|nr:hypothetical protein [Pseudomonadota bacterium]
QELTKETRCLRYRGSTCTTEGTVFRYGNLSCTEGCSSYYRGGYECQAVDKCEFDESIPAFTLKQCDTTYSGGSCREHSTTIIRKNFVCSDTCRSRYSGGACYVRDKCEFNENTGVGKREECVSHYRGGSCYVWDSIEYKPNGASCQAACQSFYQGGSCHERATCDWTFIQP